MQEQKAADLQLHLRQDVLGTNENVQVVNKDLLLKLYSAYRQKQRLTSGDESEILLDVFRRLYLSGEIRTAWRQLLPLMRILLSFQAAVKVLRFGLSYAGNLRDGFTTQRLPHEKE